MNAAERAARERKEYRQEMVLSAVFIGLQRLLSRWVPRIVASARAATVRQLAYRSLYVLAALSVLMSFAGASEAFGNGLAFVAVAALLHRRVSRPWRALYWAAGTFVVLAALLPRVVPPIWWFAFLVAAIVTQAHARNSGVGATPVAVPGQAQGESRAPALSPAIEKQIRAQWPAVAEAAGLWARARRGDLSRGRQIGMLITEFQDGRAVPLPDVPPRIVAVEDSPLGIAITVQMHPAQEVRAYEKAAQVIANNWHVSRVRVRQIEGSPYVVLTLVTRDPLAESCQLTAETVTTASVQGVEVGWQEDGHPWVFPLAENHAVVGGVPGAGKSVFANVVLAGVAPREDVQIVGIDAAGGVELSDWEPRLSCLATNQEEARSALKALWAEHERRIEWLRANGYKSVTNAGYSAEMPLWICLVDEAAQVFRLESTSKEERQLGQELVDLVTRLITVARKTGIVVILMTQKPTMNTIPTLCRDNAQVKVAFRVITPEAAKSVLGESLSVAPVSPTAIRRDQKGVAVAEGAEGELTLVRSYYIDEDTDRTIARRYAHLTKSLTVAVRAPIAGED